MKIRLLLPLCILLVGNLHAQRHTISGYVEDAKTGERLPGVSVLKTESRQGTTTNTYGFYSLTLPEGQHTISFQSMGYATVSLSLTLKKDTVINIPLEDEVTVLGEVQVSATRSQAEKVEMSSVELTAKQIKQVPAFLGEVDVLRVLQLLPGVQSGNEGTTGIYVRGGSPDQNLILLDGVPVYNASHLFGFFSVFNADAIKSVNLVKGGFPARYGGRLSSVIDISMKEGNMREFHGEGSLGLIASRLTLEGPIVKDKTSFMVSGRRTYIDVLAAPFMPEEERGGYYFYDLNAKINHKFSDKDRLYLSFYGGRDKFFAEQDDEFFDGSSGSRLRIRNRFDLGWGNATAALRWNHLFSPKLFMNLTATYSRYQFDVQYLQEEMRNNQREFIGFRYLSNIEDYALKADFDYLPAPDHHIRFGSHTIFHTFRPGVLQSDNQTAQINFDTIINLSNIVNAVENFFYVEDEWAINYRWRVNAGLHYSQYFVNDAFYHSLQPRISGRFLISDRLSAKASYATMQQYIHLLSNTGIGLPTDLWVSSTDRVPPQWSQQFAAGLAWSPSSEAFDLSVEGYYKDMTGLIEYKQGASFSSISDWQNNVEIGGRGWSYGAEVLLQRQKGNTTGWIGYTLSWTFRQFDAFNNGNPYPFRFDRRHDLSVVLNQKLGKKFDVGAVFVYGTGIATNIPIATYYGGASSFWGLGGSNVEYFGDRNSFRYPAYMRLDFSANYTYKTSWGESTWNLSVFNALNRLNPFFLYIDQPRFDQDKVVKQVSLFPIIPTLSYLFKF